MTAVIDASALAEYLVSSPVGVRVRSALEPHDGALHIPHLAVVETVSVLRAWVRRGELSLPRAEAALTDLSDLPAQRWPADPLLTSIWELRQNVTAYAGTYVVLAEALDAHLITGDRRLLRAIEDRNLKVVPVLLEDD